MIRDKYGYSDTTTAYDIEIPKGGGPWRFICASIISHPTANELMKTKLRKSVGNGSNTLFWLDIWLVCSPLKIRFPRLFSIACNPHANIASLGSWRGCEWEWNISWKRVFRVRDCEEWKELQVLLKGVCLSSSRDDCLVWSPHKSGIFSVKSCTAEIGKPSLQPHSKIHNWKRLWKGLIPPRIEVFTWLALLRKINTRQKLTALNIIPPDESTCILCNSAPEDSDHLLLHCSFASRLWSWWLQLWNLSWVFPSHLDEAFEQWVSFDKNPFFLKIWCAIFSIVIWTIWKERNARIFRGVSSSIPQLQELVLTRLMWWIKGWGENFPYSMNEVLRFPKCLSWNSCVKTQLPQSIATGSSLWSPPRSGVMKWNVDASVNAGGSRVAIGGVLRNSQGNFVCVFSSPIPPIEINSA